MGTTPVDAANALRTLGTRLIQQITQHGWQTGVPYSTGVSWQGPPISAAEFVGWWNKFVDRVQALEADQITNDLQAVLDQIPLKVLAAEPCIANMSSDHQVPFSSIQMLKNWIEVALPPTPAHLNWEDIKGTDCVPKDLQRRLSAVDARLRSMEPRTGDLDAKILHINDAHEAALALPTDLQELRDARAEISSAAEETKKMEGMAAAHLSEVGSLLEKMRRQEFEAIAIIEKCEQAFGIATTVGLAGSFTSRARWITVAAWTWVIGLIGALGASFWIGKSRFEALQSILSKNPTPTVIWVYALMAVLGIGAPIWFSWIATKQISQNFRLAEDYGFKATVARAYEGYRKEAFSLDERFASRLFESALDRLDESPIRLVDSTNHGSPLQEFLNHPNIRDALSMAPGVKNDIVAFVKSKLGAAAVGAGAVAESVTSTVKDPEKK